MAKLMHRVKEDACIDPAAVDDFYILLQDPHKSYCPGDKILGQVILTSRKHLANVAISFCLQGYVKLNALPQLKLRPVKHVLFSHTINIYGPEATAPGEYVNGLYKGEHRFPFIVKLPQKKVYTSIDFGKGAIVYVLQTHLKAVGAADTPALAAADLLGKTRSIILPQPCLYEKVIHLVNPIDVLALPAPRRKCLIIKDPRGRRVQSLNSTINTFSTRLLPASDCESTLTNLPSAHGTPASNVAPSHSSHGPANGAASCLSNVTGHATTASSSTLTRAGHLLHDAPRNTIRISMELAHRGYLRGELIPIKLNINHLKKIQDSKGIIVTLVRVCRIDHGPDGYYESFRKDLQQLVIPLFVDPTTFSLEISTSLRIPPDAFPTISDCPLVLFQYFIEVMLNLLGKSFSAAGPADQPKSAVDDPGLSPGGGNYNFHSYAQGRSDYINTDKFKRSKKFIQMATEVVIGTHRLEKTDAESLPAEQGVSPRYTALDVPPHLGSPANSPAHTNGSSQLAPGQRVSPGAQTTLSETIESPPYGQEPLGLSPQLVPLPHTPSQQPLDQPHLQLGSLAQASRPDGPMDQVQVPLYEDIAVPAPDAAVLSEKERMRQHERSLMPSEPCFSDESEPETVSPDDEALAMSEPGIHEGIGLEGATDYVPDYFQAANDRLVGAPMEPIGEEPMASTESS